MSKLPISQQRREELENYETMMGFERGRLALALDMLTDSLTLVGQHGVYCRSSRQPGKPAMDVQIIVEQLAGAKELIATVMDEMKRKRKTN